MLLQVPLRLLDPTISIKSVKETIAPATQQAAHGTGLVVVIHGEPSTLPLRPFTLGLAADGADTALSFEHGFVLLDGDAVLPEALRLVTSLLPLPFLLPVAGLAASDAEDRNLLAAPSAPDLLRHLTLLLQELGVCNRDRDDLAGSRVVPKLTTPNVVVHRLRSAARDLSRFLQGHRLIHSAEISFISAPTAGFA